MSKDSSGWDYIDAWILALFILVLFLLFAGEPDIHDKIIEMMGCP